ncbi:GNAT family N-acetyltransferase [Microbispora sp. RL4-1S]|uniref:GNAT family N-acetyltransferase n=1 Tax=Microbispora oryzae TaxID=2806554 RepID=A0A940WJA3_9ACTN|nr:GNAT family N-acetyltransferase [Microbispora oryzae]MBP2703863.1 GNAT family N-acetyltransferase [Microbispora oryzae]
MRELHTAAEVVAASEDDALIVWAAQDIGADRRTDRETDRPGHDGPLGQVRAWAHGDAVVVASPRVSRRDRMAVRGRPADAMPLIRHALAQVGPAYRPFGDADLIEELVRGVPELALLGGFSWMTTTAQPPSEKSPAPASPGPAWLEADAEPEVTRLLKAAHPDSYAMPGVPGVRRWAGVRDAGGDLVAVAADAWPAPTVGLLAGVATAVHARGRGLGERVCRFLTGELLAEHGRVALMVDDWNTGAVGLYGRLGFARRRVAAAIVGVPPV